MSKGAAAISIILALVLGFVVGSITTQSSRGLNVQSEESASTNGARQNDSTRIPVGNSPVLGPNSALVTIVEFSDFQCPFCSRVEDTLRQIRTRYGNQVRIVWKNNPLPMHADAPLAAEAAMEAHRQGKFWEMHDLLFQNQRALTRPDLERYAQQIGLNMTEFRQALDTHRHQAAVRADQDLAQRLHADGTPNFFINGTNVVGAVPLERFTAVIDAVLARARTITPASQVYARMVDDPVQAPGEQPRPNQPQPNRPPQPQLDPSTVYRIPVGNSPVRGPNDALVTMVIFSDFQCPFCSRVETTINELRQRYGNDLRIVWKNMPLDFHQNAMPAAEAAWEIYMQRGAEAFWQYHDLLFQNQQALSREDLERYAQQIPGVNMARFREALDRHTHQARIREDISLAQSVAANGTPHFFINGRRLSGARPIDQFTAAIDQARTDAQNLLRTAGVTRANVYERTIANGATAPVYLPTPGAQPGQPGGNPEDRVFTIRPNPQAPFRGNANARVVIEHFSDFQCPFCSRVDPTMRRIMETYGDRVRINWRDYPLSFHNNAMAAAEAAREAFAQRGNQGFWQYHDLLFQNQQALSREDLERYAQQIGLDMNRFRQALDDHRHQAAIRQDMAALDATGEGGTPASFINGHFVSGAQPFENFQRVIDAQLNAPARPGQAAPAQGAARPAAQQAAAH